MAVIIIIHKYLYRIGISVQILLSIYILLPNKKRLKLLKTIKILAKI